MKTIVYKQINTQYKVYGKGILFNNGIALNETAAKIFESCNTINSFNDIVLLIHEEYDSEQSEISRDVSICLQELIENELIVKEEIGE